MPMPELSIHAERCVHQRVRGATCQSCVDACPTHAWRMGDDGLAFDPDRCDACGLCAAACPTQALALPAPAPLLRSDARGRRTAWWRCERAGAPGSPTTPCLLALSPAWLHGFSRQHAVQDHVFVPGACSTCDRGAGLAEWQRQWRGLATRQPVTLRIAPAASWPPPDAPVNAGRRGFLTRARATPTSASNAAPSSLTSAREDELGRTAPPDTHDTTPGSGASRTAPTSLWAVDIVRPRCTLCLACVRLCPTHALFFEAPDADAASAQFGFDAEKCTCCGLCTAACETQAVTAPRAVAECSDATCRAADAHPVRWPTRRQRCLRCNIDFHQFSDPGSDPHWSQVCPTCAPGSRQRPNRVVQTEASP